MEYAIVVFFLGVMVTFIVAKGGMLARDEAARFEDTVWGDRKPTISGN
jgi:hypothetical protein